MSKCKISDEGRRAYEVVLYIVRALLSVLVKLLTVLYLKPHIWARKIISPHKYYFLELAGRPGSVRISLTEN